MLPKAGNKKGSKKDTGAAPVKKLVKPTQLTKEDFVALTKAIAENVVKTESENRDIKLKHRERNRLNDAIMKKEIFEGMPDNYRWNNLFDFVEKMRPEIFKKFENLAKQIEALNDELIGPVSVNEFDEYWSLQDIDSGETEFTQFMNTIDDAV